MPEHSPSHRQLRHARPSRRYPLRTHQPARLLPEGLLPTAHLPGEPTEVELPPIRRPVPRPRATALDSNCPRRVQRQHRSRTTRNPNPLKVALYWNCPTPTKESPGRYPIPELRNPFRRCHSTASSALRSLRDSCPNGLAWELD